jgi:uridine kinase
VLSLDDFYRDGDDPALPRLPGLGIVDWDDPRAWDADAAVAALQHICARGWADTPVYDISHDRATSSQRFDMGAAGAFVAEGIFAAEIVAACRECGILADAIVVRRAPWKNFLRRLARDLAERRKPPMTLVRRGWTLMRTEPDVIARQVALGARPCNAAETASLLAELATTRR